MMYRGRRLRKSKAIRNMMRETRLAKQDLVYPLFVIDGIHIKNEIDTLPEVYQYSIDRLHEVLDEMKTFGIVSCILFGIPDQKDEYGSRAYDEFGVVQRAIRYIKQNYPEMYVIGDVCMCAYTQHGHCGMLNQQGEVLNDKTLEYLNKIALSYAQAGIDMVAPSAMMDGHIASIRQELDSAGYVHVAIMGYSAKYASNYYGPFRVAANSAPSFGNRDTYQMDFANREEALREIEADIQEGADMVMVKPALAYLDIIHMVKEQVCKPLAVYNVSGEYAMLKLAVSRGIVNECIIYETVLSMKRAGADIIITYFALYIAKLLDEGEVQ